MFSQKNVSTGTIARRLLRMVFVIYFAVTFTVTALQLAGEFYRAQETARNEIDDIRQTFEASLAAALVTSNTERLQFILMGMQTIPAIAGVRVEDERGVELLSVGIPKRGTSEEDISFPIQWWDGYIIKKIGNVDIYSNSDTINERVRDRFILTLFNTSVDALTLWAILFISLRLIITRPLRILTNATEQLNPDNPRYFNATDRAGTKSDLLQTRDELGMLARSFERMRQAILEKIKDLNKMNEIIEEKNEELLRSNRLKDEFLANTSHELRTPLNGIIGIAESLQNGIAGKLPGNAIFNISLIVSSARRLASLVNDILDFSKLRHRTLVLQLQSVDLYPTVNLVLKLSEPLLQNKNVKLKNTLSPNLPPVKADENRLQQILHNLIGNAVKFTETGEIRINAGIEKLDTGDFVKIFVIDTGVGVPAARQNHIFESFEQADGSTARKYGGTGLGLTVTKQLVELHGGKISMSSEMNIGSVFSFTLPLSADPLDDDSQALDSHTISKVRALMELEVYGQETQELTTTHLDEGFKILVVDDEPINLQVIVNHLALENYSVVRATNGPEALENIRTQGKPDLVLLDVMMPKMTGYEVCQKIRETYDIGELPVIMLTAKNQVSDLVAGMEAGANDYLTKPFAREELLARIKAHRELLKVHMAAALFVPTEFLRILGHENISSVRLGDQIQQDMTILFADIRSFTELSENMTPAENFAFINSYLGQMGPIIRKNNGFIDKYIGDAVMALFPETPDDAIRAALEMQAQVRAYNRKRTSQGYEAIRIGVGVHTGSLIMGTIGDDKRMEGTVISDAVNLASRLENLTKIFGAAVIASGDVMERLSKKSDIHSRPLGKVRVKGKRTTVAVFEILDGQERLTLEQMQQTLPDFEKGLQLFHRGDLSAAKSHFETVLKIDPFDLCAQLYLENIGFFEHRDLPGHWNGVIEISNK